MQRPRTTMATGVVIVAAVTACVCSAGCDLLGGVALLPFGRIAAVQVFEEPAYTVAMSVDGAVTHPSLVEKVNWVFGDGGGFVSGPQGRSSITHTYAATGTFEVSAFVFDEAGFVVQVNGTVTVVDSGGEPGPSPAPDEPPGTISGAIPIDEAEGVAVDTTLTWTSAVGAVAYDVYFAAADGAAIEDVEQADRASDSYQGTQEATLFDPEDTDATVAGSLRPGVTYLWRVDAINEAGTTPGTVMRFTTASLPGAASGFEPAIGVMTAPVAQVLQWQAGDGATHYDVYFSRSKDAVDTATTETADVYQGRQASTTFDPEDVEALIEGQLLPEMEYYWRIDAVGPGGTAAGAVLEFVTTAPPLQIGDPDPANESPDVDVEQDLSWTGEPGVTRFAVYFGIDEAAVGAATETSPDFEGTTEQPQFDLPALNGGWDYYWRVDTVGPGGTTAGEVLSFTTMLPPPLVTEPFTPLDGATQQEVDIDLMWNEGVGPTTSSFDVYLSDDEHAVVNGQSSALQGNQDVSETAFVAEGLTSNTLYYWRVDSVGPGGTTSGPVNAFRTAPLPDQVEVPAPAPGASGVALDTSLMWAASDGATGYLVFVGTSEDAVRDADEHSAEFKEETIGNGATTHEPAEDLEEDTEYFWRIDAKGDGGVRIGDVWRFQTVKLPGKATSPSPADVASGVGLDAILSWTPGEDAVRHYIYFGPSLTDVDPDAAAKEPDWALTLYDPGSLDPDETYYWRIDEVDAIGGVRGGDVWRFTTLAEPGLAGPPTPASGAVDQPTEITLRWPAATGATSYIVYFISDAANDALEVLGEPQIGDDAPHLSVLQGEQTSLSYNPGALSAGEVTYLWRIDTVNEAGTTLGSVWRFTTEP